ncbi:MAG: hypothetical protein ACREQW_19600 [Candidatus Binatia bacterium]
MVQTDQKRRSRLALAASMLVLTCGLAACAQVGPQPIARDQLAANLAPLLKVERRAEQVKYYTLLLDKIGGIGEEGAQALKNHHDVYYVYYLAANMHLARGNLGAYRAHVKLAENELDSMEGILKESLSALSPKETQPGNHFSRFGL